jgi:hypothetical protein
LWDPRATFAQAYEEAAIYSEHTFGAADSISNPGSLDPQNGKVNWFFFGPSPSSLS